MYNFSSHISHSVAAIRAISKVSDCVLQLRRRRQCISSNELYMVGNIPVYDDDDGDTHGETAQSHPSDRPLAISKQATARHDDNVHPFIETLTKKLCERAASDGDIRVRHACKIQ